MTILACRFYGGNAPQWLRKLPAVVCGSRSGYRTIGTMETGFAFTRRQKEFPRPARFFAEEPPREGHSKRLAGGIRQQAAPRWLPSHCCHGHRGNCRWTRCSGSAMSKPPFTRWLFTAPGTRWRIPLVRIGTTRTSTCGWCLSGSLPSRQARRPASPPTPARYRSCSPTSSRRGPHA